MLEHKIRFKGWNNLAKKMISSVGFYDSDIGRTFVSEQYMLGGGEIFKDIILLQDIGLEDKRGTPIHNGDILQYTKIVNNKEVLGDIVGYVIYENCSFKVKKFNEKESDHLHRDSVIGYIKRHIVCGSIYEHPELLK